ncbi:MAG: UvrD-helicase domain-containing protein [Pseudomonadota bacterium]
MTYTYVTDCAQIDLDRHAFIEASAGTGKTYTIENLVVRLLMEKRDIELENILLVTFTEKATSELKQRIQEKLEAELLTRKNDPITLKKIKGTLDAFDTASIFTIHGFCQSVLREFAFENGSLFNNDVIDDGPLLETLLKEQMRRTWPKTYGDSLSDLLTLSGFNRQKDAFFSLVTGLVRRFRPESGDELLPRVEGIDSGEILLKIEGVAHQLRSLITSSFHDGFERLNLKKKPKELLRSFMDEISRDAFDITRLAPVLSNMALFKNASADDLWLKNKQNSAECPDITRLFETAAALFEESQVLPHLLTLESIDRLRKDAMSIKQQNGWLSYDDMISRVAAALQGPTAGELLHRLRRKYKVAFVDEFQDTDPAQWRIFSKIFLETDFESENNRLYLIGDPKQAIYAFRGADVFVYLEAKNEMIKLAEQGRARLYSLATNWRSQPELIGAFNRLFGEEAWFGPLDETAAFKIGYLAAGFADEPLRPEILAADHSGRPAFNIFDISRHTQAKRVKSELANVITDEIRHLMHDGGIEIQKKDSPARPLTLGDICILVRGKNDLTLLEPLLIQKKIPYTYYKKPGLFFSDEALHLSLVFHAVLYPESSVDVRKALLTPFFNFQAQDLNAWDLQPVTHPLRQLLHRWNTYAENRQWSQLFQSLMEESGLIFREAPAHDWDRKQTNYSQMFEHLESVAYRRNLDFRSLSALLDSYRKDTADADDNADIHQIETEDKKVQVMTMHVSKGLQFPIVFIAGGLAQSNRAPYYIFHRCDGAPPSAGIRKVIDLSKTTDHKVRHDQEVMDENKRLFYVALTRAQFKLYVPYYAPSTVHRLNGPVPTLLTPAIDAVFPRDEKNSEVMWLMSDARDAFEKRGPGIAPLTKTDEPVSETDPGGYRSPLPRAGDYRTRRYRMESFSSLHARDHFEAPPYPEEKGFHTTDTTKREDDERYALAAAEGAPHPRQGEIPGGADTGSMLHDILEVIDFQTVAKYPDGLLDRKDTRETIENAMARYGIDPAYRNEVCNLIAATLTAKVPVSENVLILGNLKPSQRLHETEFYFPMPMAEKHKPVIPELDIKGGEKGYIHGFIDLIFHTNGKFYIADWKSNRLEGGYDRASLEKSMTEADYHLQYKIYTVATLRWLQKTGGNRFDPALHFGGIFYFYLRGMGTGDGFGIYHVTPDEVGRLDRLEQDIARAAGA